MSILAKHNAKEPALVEWRQVDGRLTPVNSLTGKKLTWCPQPGSQDAFLRCPVREVLYAGSRGPGKSDAMLMDFAQDVGKGYGQAWRGVIFRRTVPELRDIVGKSKRWFPEIFGNSVKYNEGKSIWHWTSGEELWFRPFPTPDSYYSYHGHEIPWIGWEELTTWPTDACLKSMISCNRSTGPKGMPRKIRATTNPFGVGHNWVKRRYSLPVPPGLIVGELIQGVMDEDGQKEPDRLAIHGNIHENRILMQADPGYLETLRGSACNAAQAEAWINGSWDVVSGGMFDDLWEPHHHVLVDLFNFPLQRIPSGWRIDRSYDHGQSKPFSVAWWAESNGEPLRFEGRSYGTVPGDIFRIAEWYGCEANSDNKGLRLSAREIAQGIKDREVDFGIRARVKPGPADNSIFDGNASDPTTSVANDMRSEGVIWLRSDKSPGSRVQGWQQIRAYLKGALPDSSGYRESPGLFFLPRCKALIRTLPALPRSDKNPDDVDTDAEDHAADEARYRLRYRRSTVSTSAM